MPGELRDWQLVKRFGMSYEEIRESPAVWLDWMLAIDGTASEIASRKG